MQIFQFSKEQSGDFDTDVANLNFEANKTHTLKNGKSSCMRTAHGNDLFCHRVVFWFDKKHNVYRQMNLFALYTEDVNAFLR